MIESRNDRFPVGMPGLRDARLADHAPCSPAGAIRRVTYEQALSVFGTGTDRVRGSEDIGKPQPGETVGGVRAAGGVGSIAGQIAKIMGAG